LSAHPVIGTRKGAIRSPENQALDGGAQQGQSLPPSGDSTAALDRARKAGGLDESIVSGIIDELLDATEDVLDAAAGALPVDYPMDVAESIFQGVRAQVKRLNA